jgi:hypothetical protein
MSLVSEDMDLETLENSSVRRNSDYYVHQAMLAKRKELEQYKVKLYEPYAVENTTSSKKISVNKILESKHNLNVENQILNFFIIAFSVFITFQLVLIVLLKIEHLSFDYEPIVNYAYCSALIIGKVMNLIYLITFFIRCYIGVRIFHTNTKSLILFKLLDIQFKGFMSSFIMITTLLLMNYGFRTQLMRMELLSVDGSNSHFSIVYESLKNAIGYTDLPVLCVVISGVVLSALRKAAKLIRTESRYEKKADAKSTGH